MTTPKGLESWVQPRDKTEVEFTDGQVRTFKFGVKAPTDATPQKLQVQVDWVDVADPTNRVSRSQAVDVEVGVKKADKDGPPWPLLIAIAALVLIGAGVGIYFAVRPNILVPPLVGRTLAHADSQLTDLQLKPTVVDSMLPALPPGIVVSQEPDSETKLRKNGEVRIFVVSDTGTVPAVTSRQANEADSLLVLAGFHKTLTETLTAGPQVRWSARIPLPAPSSREASWFSYGRSRAWLPFPSTSPAGRKAKQPMRSGRLVFGKRSPACRSYRARLEW